MNKNFTKPALSNTALIDLLQQRGLVIKNPLEAVTKLQTVGYYRFSAYFKSFFNPKKRQHRFINGVDFNQLWSLYNFDSELRSLVYAGLEKIEIAFRAAINDYMCINYHPNWYQEVKYFQSKTYHDQFLQKVKLVCKTKVEPFIRHYYSNYYYPNYPPGWMIIQCMTFGVCCSIFKNIKYLSDLKEIAKLFNQHPRIIESWMEALCYTRNICAHHARLWNRWFIIRPIQPKYNWSIKSPERSFHEQLAVILSLLSALNQRQAWQDKLYILFSDYPAINYTIMGFIKEWHLDPIWRHFLEQDSC